MLRSPLELELPDLRVTVRDRVVPEGDSDRFRGVGLTVASRLLAGTVRFTLLVASPLRFVERLLTASRWRD